MAPGLLDQQPSSSLSTPPLLDAHPPPADLHPSSDQILLSTLSSAPFEFLQPSSSLHTACLISAKKYLDPLAVATGVATERRLQRSRKQRKRGEVGDYTSADVLRLTQVHVDGFDVNQIWEQARRILNASCQEIERALSDVVHPVTEKVGSPNSLGDPLDEHILKKPLEFDPEGFAVDTSDSDDGSDGDAIGPVEDDDVELVQAEDRQEYLVDDAVADSNLGNDEDSEDSIDPNDHESLELEKDSGDVFVPDKNGLNDGFFSIDDFNKQSQFLEQQDTRGELANEDASEDEEIDWTADPSKMPPLQNGRPSLGANGAEEDSLDDDDGPTFGNADLEASDSDDDMQIEDADPMQNTNDIKYADFFAPPARPATKRTHRRALPKTQPPPQPTLETEQDIQRTISGVRHDLFDVSQGENASDSQSDGQFDGEPSARSNHQRRQAALAAEIRKLEAANVAKRDWTLSGEARAADRPINSLLEEDLDFERAGKPIPVITNEVSEDIEALIKRRIVAREFDEVLRRRPDNLATGDSVRRGPFELDDTKPQQSLAEIYEAEHLKTADPGYVDPDHAKLKEQHEAIEALWKKVSAELDGLSSLHFKPGPPEAVITVIRDVPAITMEDAWPSAGGDAGGASMLAPQEVYKVGEGRIRDDRVREVVRKGGAVVGREEMGRDERRRARRREKERARKSGGTEGRKSKDVSTKDGKTQRKREAKQVEATLKRGGVRVIGRKGEIRDAHGREVKDDKATGGNVASFKL